MPGPERPLTFVATSRIAAESLGIATVTTALVVVAAGEFCPGGAEGGLFWAYPADVSRRLIRSEL